MTTPLTTSPLTDQERAGADRLADLWFPGTARSPRMTELPDYLPLIGRGLAANDELASAFREIAVLASQAPEVTAETVATWPQDVVEGAFMLLLCTYYMSRDVRTAIGYPGQDRVPVANADPDQLVTDELLAPVIARGATYVPTPGSVR